MKYEVQSTKQEVGFAMIKRISSVFLVVSFVYAFPTAQGRGGQPPTPPPAAGDATPRHETAGEKEEKISTTSHTLRLDGREIRYTATAGTLPIRLDNGR